MIAVLLRCVLLILLLATVSSRIYGYSNTPPDERAIIVRVLERQGLSVLGHSQPYHRSWLFFSAPGCDGAVQVVSLSLGLQEVPQVRQAIGPGNVSYQYFARAWSDAGIFDVRLEWVRQRVHSLLAGRRPALIKTVLLVVAPAGCRALEAIDWRPVWDET